MEWAMRQVNFTMTPRVVFASMFALGLLGPQVSAQDLGPFMPHPGGTLTTAWTNDYGPDADSWISFGRVTSEVVDINYSSSRGTVAVRRQLTADRRTAHTLVLGYGPKMPLVLPGTTSLGISTAVLDELRTSGASNASLIYSSSLATMSGQFTLLSKG